MRARLLLCWLALLCVPAATAQPDSLRALSHADTARVGRAGGEGERHFVLDIAEHRITETYLRVGTILEIHPAASGGRLWLRAGVSLEAQRVVILLRNVQGEVYFRASPGALDLFRAGPRPENER